MTGRTYAGRCHGDLAWIVPGEGDQLGNGFGHYRGISQHDLRLPDQARDRRDVAQKHEIKLVVERGVDRARGPDHEERIAVGRRAHDRLGRDIGAGARPILDNEWLAQPLLQPLSDHARADVSGAAGGETDDDAHRPRRIGLRARHARHGYQHGSARGQLQDFAAGKLHGGPGAEDADRKPAYSVLTAAALMIGVQRAISSLTSVARGCWPRRALSGISLPRLSRRFRVFSSSSAWSSASLSLSRIGFGVPLGANKAFQADAWNCGSPASSEVGTSGSAELRLELPMA